MVKGVLARQWASIRFTSCSLLTLEAFTAETSAVSEASVRSHIASDWSSNQWSVSFVSLRITSEEKLKNPLRALVRVVGIASVAALALSGCSSEPQPQPQTGGDLVIARGGDSGTLVPTEAGGNDSIWVLQQIFDTLLVPSSDGTTIEPNLATSYTQSSDGLSWTLPLRDDVKFSDGTPMTAKDVVFSLKTASNPELPFGSMNDGISDITASDDHTVVVTTSQPWAPLPSVLALFSNSIVPDNYGGKTLEEFEKAPIGTGPFRLDRWDEGQTIKLVKNDQYWQAGLPLLDSVSFNVVGEANTRLLQVKSGQAQVDEFPAYSSLAANANDTSVDVQKYESSRVDYLIMSNKSEHFTDQHVRAAVAHAVDKQAIVSAVLFGNGEPANSFMAPAMWGYDKDQQVRDYNLDEARKELAQSKYPDGFNTTIEIVSGNDNQKQIAEIVQQSLKEIGINAEITSKDDSAAGDDRVNGTYDMAFTYFTTDISDPDENVKFVAVENGGANAMRTFHENKEIEALADEAAAESDSDRRLELYKEIQTKFNDDQALVPLYFSPSVYITSKKLHDFNISTMGRYELTHAWIEH